MKIIHRGRVVDEAGKPLVGANIVTINSNPKRGVITDSSGNFVVDGSLHESFEIKFLGFGSQIFRLDRFMGNKTYRLKESATELDGFTGYPKTPTPPRRNTGIDLEAIFGTVLDGVFKTDPTILQTPGFNPAQIKVPTITAPLTINPVLPSVGPGGQPNRVQSPPVQSGGGGVTDWVKNNPLTAGGLLLAAIGIGTVALNKNKAEE